MINNIFLVESSLKEYLARNIFFFLFDFFLLFQSLSTLSPYLSLSGGLRDLHPIWDIFGRCLVVKLTGVLPQNKSSQFSSAQSFS